MKHCRSDYNRFQDPAGLIPEDEPVFIIRAQDETFVETVRYWLSLNPHLPDSQQNKITEFAMKARSWAKKRADIPSEAL